MPSSPKLCRRSNKSIPWSQLLPEILGKIIDGLSPMDSVRFRWVCQSWRSVTTTTNKNPTLEPPQLLLLRPTPAGGQELGFFSISRREFVDLDLDLPNAFRHSRCCGSLEGWLIMVSDRDLLLSLLHPISRSHFSLPSRPQCFIGTKFEDPTICRITKATLSSPPSSSDCIVAALAGYNIILLCRPGDDEWSVFEGGLASTFQEIIFYKGQLCALDERGKLTIISLDSRLRGSITLEVQALQEMTPPPGIKYIRRDAYLVESSGDLLVVVKHYISPAVKFFVFKLQGNKWVRVPSLGERALFVGAVRSESVMVKDVKVSGCRENHIYFTTNQTVKIVPGAIGLFSIENQSAEPIPVIGEYSLRFDPVWVKPTLYQ